MSEAEHQATDILLPGARLFVFSNDEDTLNSAAVLKEDWRFARVEVVAMSGDVETAIETLKTQPSPDLIVIQTDEIDDAFTARLGELSNYCEEGTGAIIVGPLNDVYLYRKLIEMGVSDYLVRPIMPEVLRDVVSKTLVAKLGVSDSRLVAFIGAKGGVGTSTLTQIAAWSAAKTLGHKTLLMDASGGWSSLSVGAGFDPSASLHEIAKAVETNNEDALKRMFFRGSEELTILASGADAMLDPSVTAAQYEAILDNLMVKSPLVFVDLSGAGPALKKAVIARAHLSVVVTTPTVTSLRFCRSLIKELAEIRGGSRDELSLVVNKQGISKAHEVDGPAIAEALEFETSLSLVHMPSLFLKYESDIEKIFSDKEGESLATAFLPILQKVIMGDVVSDEGKKDSASGFLGGFLDKLTAK